MFKQFLRLFLPLVVCNAILLAIMLHNAGVLVL